MKRFISIFLKLVLLLGAAFLIYYKFNKEQDELVINALDTYFNKNEVLITSSATMITSFDNLINKNMLSSDYENKIIKVSYKNDKIKYEEIDEFTLTTDSYEVVETTNENVISQTLFYEDDNYSYYLSDTKNYFIKQNNILIPLYDICSFNIISKEDLLKIIPLEKIAKNVVDNSINNKDNNKDIKEEKSDEQTEEKTDDNISNNDKDITSSIITPKDDIVTSSSFVIEDRSGDYCAMAIDEFYQDSTGIYYFTCQKSNNIYIVFTNGDTYSLKSALENGKVTIDDLYQKGLKPLKKEFATK